MYTIIANIVLSEIKQRFIPFKKLSTAKVRTLFIILNSESGKMK